ncbi:hypothetical protein BDV59DRAFT_198690 [Aspergillus ambiguus]|uniref:aspartate/glutamate racemase family protein n=1 Tax=Aspergillus ambiguus TaxID=176160 RepID=UPI003CCD2CE4
MAEAAKKYKSDDTHITVASLSPSMGGYTSMVYPALRPVLYAELVRVCLHARMEGYDAIIVNCFGDPLIDELRQISGDMLIIGAAKSATQIARQLGERYSIMTVFDMESSTDPHVRCSLENSGAVSHRSVDMQFNNDLTLKDAVGLEERIITQSRLAIEQDGAGVVVLGCVSMVGRGEKPMQAVGVPIIDPVVAAIKTAESLAQMRRDYGWGTCAKGRMNVPSMEELEMIASPAEPYRYSGRIEVE